MLSDDPGEGVVTQIPSGVLAGTRAKRYSAEANVPLLERPFARQIGAAGFWYVLAPSLADIWDQSVDAFYQGLDTGQVAGQAIDTAVSTILPVPDPTKGLLGIVSSLLGIPMPVALVSLAFLGYALLQAEGLVPPLGRVFK